MDRKQFKNATLGQQVSFFDGWGWVSETVVAIDNGQYGVNQVITQRGRFYALYTAPNQAPDEVFTAEARLDHITATFRA